MLGCSLPRTVLPLLSTVIAKAGGKGSSNVDPRANAVQQNLFKGLPLFYAAVLFALYNQIDPALLRNLMALWIALRLGYVTCYFADKVALRSLVCRAARQHRHSFHGSLMAGCRRRGSIVRLGPLRGVRHGFRGGAASSG